MKRCLAAVIAGVMLSFFAAGPSMAGEADIVGVKVFKLKKKSDTTFRFRVTVQHDDEGWDHYADAWDVVGPDGAVLGTRVLHHPHVEEQPFTRTTDLVIPKSITQVVIRAHDKVHGYGGATMTVRIPH